MSDVSITDLIAEARKAAKRADYYQSGEAWLWLRLADALEAVTVPTENEREVLIEQVLSESFMTRPSGAGVAKWAARSLVAAGFRLPVPVEPEKPVALKGEPHSRACGWRLHDHGTECHTNCPTCEGGTHE
jgi:hypothetical protein